MSPANQGMHFSQFVINFVGLNMFFKHFQIYFNIKGLKSVYGIEQLDTGSSSVSLSSWSMTVLQ